MRSQLDPYIWSMIQRTMRSGDVQHIGSKSVWILQPHTALWAFSFRAFALRLALSTRTQSFGYIHLGGNWPWLSIEHNSINQAQSWIWKSVGTAKHRSARNLGLNSNPSTWSRSSLRHHFVCLEMQFPMVQPKPPSPLLQALPYLLFKALPKNLVSLIVVAPQAIHASKSVWTVLAWVLQIVQGCGCLTIGD
jgi:hypothetical protein